jgi:hypothetical protein
VGHKPLWLAEEQHVISAMASSPSKLKARETSTGDTHGPENVVDYGMLFTLHARYGQSMMRGWLKESAAPGRQCLACLSGTEASCSYFLARVCHPLLLP